MRHEPRFIIAPAVWAAAITSLWLLRYDGWIWPVQVAQNLAGFSFRPGAHLGAFLLESARAGATVALILLAAFALGASVLAKSLPEKNLTAALFALATGLWLLSASTLFAGMFSVTATPCLLALALCWLLPWPRQFLRRSVRCTPLSWTEKTLLGLLILAGVLQLIGALCPPFEYDELEYHLGALAEYRRAGRIVFLPHNFYSNLPQLTEMLYLLGSDSAAKLMHWTFGVLAAAAIYTVARHRFERRIALTAALLFYCTPFVQELSMTARVDLATTFFAALSFGGLLQNKPMLSAIAAGCAVATKWTAIPVALLPALVFVAVTGKSLRLTIGYMLVAVIIVLPWLAKNWCLTGNPIYPLCSQAPTWSVEQAALFARKHYGSFDQAGLWQFFERIWQISFIEPGATPLLLVSAPLALALRQPPLEIRRAACLFALAYATWYLTTFRPWRFLLPAFPLLALIGAWALWHTRWTRPFASIVLAFAITIMTFNVLDDIGARSVNPLNYALGKLSRRDFLARIGGGTFEPIFWMNDHLPPSAKVLYLGEARPYYAKHTVVWTTAFDRFPPDATRGLTHIYVNFTELRRLRENYGYPRGLDTSTILAHCGREIYRSYRAAVFEWKP
ncbi:MAG: glycosyltransferase family 39 protein [Verrucomicrobiae bacterium]|nr:glycosyltransferase family 39 protein [Verrucomicrobiae bacterium]